MHNKSFSFNASLTTIVSLLVLFFTLASPVSADKPLLTIENAWIAEAPPVSKVMVGYLTISNNTSEKIEVTRAVSDLYSSIEFHETKHEKGMARMIRHESLIVPANDKLLLKRGGNHLMLFNPEQRLKAGDKVEITFTLSNGSTQIINFPVKKPQF